MIPGGTGLPPVEFPETWLGLWKDATGRVAFIRSLGPRQLLLSFAQGTRLPFYPLADGGLTVNLSGIYSFEPGVGPFVIVKSSHADDAATFVLRFNCPQGDRLRFAEPWDLVSLISMVPSAQARWTEIPWLEPMGPYEKANDDLEMFLALNPGLTG